MLTFTYYNFFKHFFVCKVTRYFLPWVHFVWQLFLWYTMYGIFVVMSCDSSMRKGLWWHNAVMCHEEQISLSYRCQLCCTLGVDCTRFFTVYCTAGTASRQHPNTPANHHHRMPIPPESVMASTYRSDAGTVPMHAASDLTALRRSGQAVPSRAMRPLTPIPTREVASVESCHSHVMSHALSRDGGSSLPSSLSSRDPLDI